MIDDAFPVGPQVQVSALTGGHRITVVGTRIEDAYIAAKVRATGKTNATPKPRPSVTPTTPATPEPWTSPTGTPAPQPVDSGDPEPIETPQQ
jgi:hypothetical protein